MSDVEIHVPATAHGLTREELERAKHIRAQLPLQVDAKLAELLYHTIRWDEARPQIIQTLPRRLFRRRHAVVWPIAEYPRFIPDEVLLKWQKAQASDLFTSFWVAEPSYERQSLVREDPWLIGLRVKDSPPFWDYTPVSIIAHWE